MKMRRFALLLAVCLIMTLSASALGENTGSVAGYSGTVDWRNTITLTAPFGGTLEDFTLHAGDAVKAGQTLFSLATTKVYAPLDGTVRGLRAQAGDEAATVSNRYGALAYIEPAGRYTLSANTGNAYKSDTNHNANRYLNEGETVYLRSSDDNNRTGVGVVTSVDGRNFTVEIEQSNLDMEDTVSVYRDQEFSLAQRVASSAKVKRAAAVAITAEGSVLSCAVAEGATVKRGDLLFEMVTGTLNGLAGMGIAVSSPVDGVVVSIAQTAGANVQQKQVLATLYANDALWVAFDVDESDLDTITDGGRVTVKLDALANRDVIEGTIASVSRVNSADNGDAKYTAYVELVNTENLRPGMSVSVYPEK